MTIRFYNTLTHSVDDFKPITPGQVAMYNCGPTVYDYAHIGNFRAFVFADVLRRFLETAGHEVRQVMNITDVGHMTDDAAADGGGEDKMAAAARRLKESKKSGVAPVDNPDDPYAVAKFFTEAFIADARRLRLKIADEYPQRMPRATAHVEQMLAMIQRLLDNGHAYVAPDGAVYYDVQSFPAYGRLSGNTLDQLRGGAGGRVDDAHQKAKKHPADFLLWKPDQTHLMKWNPRDFGVELGEGYPGWHIECSAMATALLGQPVIDIHTGGEDNIFPHHECEIAQSCGASGEASFAHYWMHTRFLLVDGAKMSKSKGNFFTVRDVLEGRVTGRRVDPAVLRYELLKAHYRSQANFTARSLEDSGKAVQKIREAYSAGATSGGGVHVSRIEAEGAGVLASASTYLSRFNAALADDLNVAGALGALHELINDSAIAPAEKSQALQQMDAVIGVLEPSDTPEATNSANPASATSGDGSGGGGAQQLCQALDAARAAKDFATADALRQQLIDAGYDVKTTREGTTASKRLA